MVIELFYLRAEFHVYMACTGFVSGPICQEFDSLKCETTTLKPGKLPLDLKQLGKCSISTEWKVYRQT